MNHATELWVSPIEDTKYLERNYMTRNIIKLRDLDNAKGGDVIDILNKPTTYAGSHKHITNKGAIFKKG